MVYCCSLLVVGCWLRVCCLLSLVVVGCLDGVGVVVWCRVYTSVCCSLLLLIVSCGVLMVVVVVVCCC